MARKGSRFGEPPTIAHVGYILFGAGTASDSHRGLFVVRADATPWRPD